jgi:hypothetical protein
MVKSPHGGTRAKYTPALSESTARELRLASGSLGHVWSRAKARTRRTRLRARNQTPRPSHTTKTRELQLCFRADS